MSPIVTIIWSPQAIQDLQKRYQFLFEKDMELAKRMTEQVLHFVEKLEKHPQIGRPSMDLEAEHRELLIPFGGSGYLLLYEQLQDKILILAFRHQKEVGY